MKLNNLKISAKLLFGFGMVIILTLVLAVFGYIQLNKIDKDYSNLMDSAVVSQKSLIEIGRSYLDYRRIVATTIFRSGDIKAIDSLKANYEAEKTEIQRHFVNYFATMEANNNLDERAKAERRNRVGDIQAKINTEYEAIVRNVFAFAYNNDEAGAIESVNEAATIANYIDGELNALIASAQEVMDTSSMAATNSANTAKLVLITVSLLVVLLAVIIAMIIANNIKRGVNDVTQAAQKISKGDFDVSVGSNGKDELAILSNSLLEVKTVVKNIATEIDKVANNFATGNLDDLSVNTSAYNGEFLSIAESVNRTVSELVDNCLYSVQVISDIGNGKFDIDVRQFPGQRIVMTDSFQAVKDNLIRFNNDIVSIIEGAAQGNLSVNINTSLYKGDWGKMANGINGLLAAIVKPIREAITVLNQLSIGNLDISVTGDYQGEFDAMKSTLNNTLKMLASYIKEISSVLGSMSKQDLTVAIDREYIGEFAEIKKAINNIANVFNLLIHEISSAADQVAAGSRQISESSMSLAQGTSEQASSVEELNATIEDVANQTANNAKNTERANALAHKAKETAENGNKEMLEMLGAMSGINESSINIAKIIKVIDDIAFQTNLLALNASVEAARAGDHGKGFAVVAEEVRNLAGRSQSAARDTAALIEGSTKKVSAGSKIANETAKALETIVSEINEISDTISEVTQASIRQTEAIGHINIGINQISEVTQNNSATSEEQASAAEELSSQAELFRSMVNKFKL